MCLRFMSVAFNEVVFHLSSVFSRHTLLKWRVYSPSMKMKKLEIFYKNLLLSIKNRGQTRSIGRISHFTYKMMEYNDDGWTTCIVQRNVKTTVLYKQMKRKRFYWTIVTEKTNEIDRKWIIILGTNEINFFNWEKKLNAPTSRPAWTKLKLWHEDLWNLSRWIQFWSNS